MVAPPRTGGSASRMTTTRTPPAASRSPGPALQPRPASWPRWRSAAPSSGALWRARGRRRWTDASALTATTTRPAEWRTCRRRRGRPRRGRRGWPPSRSRGAAPLPSRTQPRLPQADEHEPVAGPVAGGTDSSSRPWRLGRWSSWGRPACLSLLCETGKPGSGAQDSSGTGAGLSDPSSCCV